MYVFHVHKNKIKIYQKIIVNFCLNMQKEKKSF